VTTNDVYLRPDAGDGVNGVRLRTDAPDSGGIVNYTLVCAAGAYSYLGKDATLSLKHNLLCATGGYSYSGVSASLVVAHNLVCGAGSYTYTGVATTLSLRHSLVCAAGAYSYSGVAATLSVKHSLTCAAGAYTYSGIAATLTYVPGVGAGSYVLTCAAGAYTYSGVDAGLLHHLGVVQQGGGIAKFIPLRAAEVKVKSVRLSLAVGTVKAVGVTTPGEFNGLQPALTEEILPSRVRTFKHVADVDTSRGTVATVEAGVVKIRYGSRAAEAGGFVQVGSTALKLETGSAGALAGGYVKIPTEKVRIATGDVTVTGILNPSVEEIMLMYRMVRRNRRLQT
jgi:hypothetical protein